MSPTDLPAAAHLDEAEQRPWGSFEVLAERPAIKLKRLDVQPGARLSLQRHRLRHEHWFVIDGLAEVEVDGTPCTLGPGDSINVPLGAWHRLANIGQGPLTLIEIQTGSGLREDDIERAADDYGRHLPGAAS
ncbi:phosphomannose isomerase type II C-terminal cupin domain [Aquincola sp. S2]|uniref:Phosphomannose isomerase type II C-terminal cupin domain n=1 Tax=Pseudaquabacterium terrae TaxID=2732868 RepID=A0ABX2EP61_9BURK|nr:phosphomannose isomerase type II C-terminal cupin domain [Aquabacterium terrae]NRF70430.1 phosphomannose isomerase type II C-terminal cupin domain [Aquabacterium terrae]